MSSPDERLGWVYAVMTQLVFMIIGLLPGIGIGYWIWG